MDKASIIAITLTAVAFSAGLVYSIHRIGELEHKADQAEETLAELLGRGNDIRVWTEHSEDRILADVPFDDWHDYSAAAAQVPDVDLSIHLSNTSLVYLTYTLSYARPEQIPQFNIRFGVFINPEYNQYLQRWITLPSYEGNHLTGPSNIVSFHVVETLPPGTHVIHLFWDQEVYDPTPVYLNDRRVTAIAFLVH